jgi:hypothetical protein
MSARAGGSDVPPARRRVRAAVAVTGLLLCVGGIGGFEAAAQSPAELELAVKATYLYKLIPFVEWPDRAFPPQGAPVALCVVGFDPFGIVVDRAVRGERVYDRPIQVRRIATLDADSGCHVAFVGGSAAQPVEEALEAVRGVPVLTVTDSAIDPHAKGIVHFGVDAQRVRFEIDDLAAAQAELRLSSAVLDLAVSVRPRSS